MSRKYPAIHSRQSEATGPTHIVHLPLSSALKQGRQTFKKVSKNYPKAHFFVYSFTEIQFVVVISKKNSELKQTQYWAY